MKNLLQGIARKSHRSLAQGAFKKRKKGAHNSVVHGCWVRFAPGTTNASHNRVVRSDLERALSLASYEIVGFCFLALLSLLGPPAAKAGTVVNADWTVNTPIPAGSPVGITTFQSFQILDSAAISTVTVDVNINGGYNGSLYAYLTLQDANGHTATETLLNQIGTSSSNPFGSSGAGMNVTLSDNGTANGTIHLAAGIPTGLWLPDANSSLNGTFGGLTANGTWTLFVAATYAGVPTGTLQSWGLNVATVPEPGFFSLAILSCALWTKQRLTRRGSPA
ncbi:MAG: hypothetical protein C5B50_08405 [Verrucomicrobia bacterium]|nr:MAG: hypothetical protein C5B50_08405 [Verrucomicrobiota bacterium]